MALTAPKMTGPEVLAEIDWLLGGNMHPLLVLHEMHRTAGGVAKAARTHGRPDLVTIFSRIERDQRARPAAA